MAKLIVDRGRGPEIVGTRITVYDLLVELLQDSATEDYICRVYNLSPEQVAAARAYILKNADTVLAEHLKIESRRSAGNPPEVVERAEGARAKLLAFKEWLERREQDEAAEPPIGGSGPAMLPGFREWLAGQEQRSK